MGKNPRIPGEPICQVLTARHSYLVRDNGSTFSIWCRNLKFPSYTELSIHDDVREAMSKIAVLALETRQSVLRDREEARQIQGYFRQRR